MENGARWFGWLPRPSVVEWICIVIGTILAVRYAWLMDDAYVYYRYVDNLVLHGHGLVWNAGEFVEGYSSPLWCCFLVALRTLGFDFWAITVGAAVFSYLLFAFLLIDSNRSLSGPKAGMAINFPLIHMSVCYGVACYWTSGLESPFVQVCGAAFACLLMRKQSAFLQVLVGLAPMVRHELALPWLIMLWVYRTEKRLPWWMIGTTAASLGGWILFRIYYYAEIFPNTFYLKDEWLVGQGLAYLYDTLVTYFSLQILLAFALIHVYLRRTNNLAIFAGKPRATMLLMAGLVTLYVIKIGGDPRHYRYFSFVYPLAIAATGGLLEQLVAGARQAVPVRYVVGASVLLISFGMLCFPHQLVVHPLALDGGRKNDHRMAMKINDAYFHRRDHRFTPPTLTDKVGPTLDDAWATLPPRKPTVVDSWVCALAYRVPQVHVVHNLGLTEPVLARVIAKSNRPAHKMSLMPLARNIVRIREMYPRGPGAFQRAAKHPKCPGWIIDNLPSLIAIEKKMYNRHDFFENLKIAFTRIPRLEIIPPKIRAAKAREEQKKERANRVQRANRGKGKGQGAKRKGAKAGEGNPQRQSKKG